MELETVCYAMNAIDRKYSKSELSKTLKRRIKCKEKYLGRTCRSIWSHINPEGTMYLFGSFCRNYDRLIVTIAYFEKRINVFLPV